MASGLAGPALAQAKKAQLCGESAALVERVAEARAGGANPARVRRDLERDDAVPAMFRPLVGPIVKWVFAVPEAQVTAKGGPGTLARKYRDNCLSYKP